MILLAIDPGNIESGYCIVDVDTLRPLEFGKLPNEELLDRIPYLPSAAAIERISSYGMAVGREVFETAEWFGRFWQKHEDAFPNGKRLFVYRREEKLHICDDSKAKDSNIRIALISRFAKTLTGKGTKKEPDFFYGFAKDMWAAYAVAVTAIETKMKGGRNACL